MFNDTLKFASDNYIYLIHILIVAPLLIYAATRLTNKTDKVLKMTLYMFGFAVLGYHLSKLYGRMQLLKNIKN